MLSSWWNTRATRSGHVPLAILVLVTLQFTHALHTSFVINLLICAAVGLLVRPLFKKAGWTTTRKQSAPAESAPADR
jgi:hypothetical protein